MSGPLGSSQWMYSSGGFYPTEIDQSLRFDDSSYLSRTPSVTGNRRTWTFSGWVKRSELGTGASNRNSIFGSDDTNSPTLGVIFKFQDDNLEFISSGGGVSRVTSNAVYRDSSAWYHCVLSVDTTQSTASNRAKMYVNGEQITSLANAVYPSQNTDFNINTSSYTMRLGVEEDTSSLTNYLNGYLADTYFIDGTALAPTSFGEFKSGVWIPKAYTGSYGTNGFHLEYNGNANDSSGNSNNFATNSIASTDYMPDTPTNNFATLNETNKGVGMVLAEGALKVQYSGSGRFVSSTIGMSSGKWYFEYLKISGSYGACGIGLTTSGPNTGYVQQAAGTFGYISNGSIWPGATGTGAAYTSGDIIGVAFDADIGKVTFYKNNVLQAYIASLASSTYLFLSGDFDTVCASNFGQDSSFAGNKTPQGNSDANGIGDFYYAPPAGFLALCTANLPEPSISPADDASPQDHFNTVLWTGDGNEPRSITGVGFQPDFVWSKRRDASAVHLLADAVRGADTTLSTEIANAEEVGGTYWGHYNSFDADGFTVDGVETLGLNNSSSTYVAWNWKASNATAVSNTAGTITSQVSANPTAGFSIVSFSPTALGTVGHGLSAAPELLILKSRSVSSWYIWHESFGATDWMTLNTTNAKATGSTTLWNNMVPTASVFGTGDWAPEAMIAYCFSGVEGYSKFGSYTGNGSTNGPFVYTGFRPAFVFGKDSSSTNNWFIFDSVRDTYNVAGKILRPNLSDAELDSPPRIDLLSNGFKVRSAALPNDSGQTYIYMAFAENPFKYANAR